MHGPPPRRVLLFLGYDLQARRLNHTAATTAAMPQRRQRESRAAPGKAHSVAAKAECPEVSVLLRAEGRAWDTEQHEDSMEMLTASADEFQKCRDRVVIKTEDLSEAEIQAITQGGMDARHGYLNAELDQGIGNPLSQ